MDMTFRGIIMNNVNASIMTLLMKVVYKKNFINIGKTIGNGRLLGMMKYAGMMKIDWYK
jgi:hypothetical protein